MENFNKRDSKEQDIVYSHSIKAGKRIYYLDVKKNKHGEMYIALTESKKIVKGFDENAQVSFEKHKIFIYPEDFSKFEEGFSDVLSFIRREDPETEERNKQRVAESEAKKIASSFTMEEFE